MKTLVKPRESETPTERVKPATRPATPASVVIIEEYFPAPGIGVEAARAPLRRVPADDGNPSLTRKGVWSALLAIINGPAVTQRERARREAYVERIKGNGILTRFISPRS